MISKNTTKLIKSLAHKKFRIQENLFLVEGDKNVLEVLNSAFVVEQLFATNDFLNAKNVISKNAKTVQEVSKEAIKKSSLLKNPQNSIALCKLPAKLTLPPELNNLSVYLDGIQDPGNLGTIIRVCDWFGIQQLFCSPDTADLYNPKVIQATMGSFCRVQTCEATFPEIVLLAKKSVVTILGAFMDGKNIYKEELPKKSLLVMGNEGNGIRPEVESLINRKISIPKFTEDAESLNVAIATSIIVSEFKRKIQ